MPNIRRGGQMGGLMVYLAGGGRHNEHEEQHLVAGDSAITPLRSVVVSMFAFIADSNNKRGTVTSATTARARN